MSQVNPQTILEDEGLFAAADGFVAPLSQEELLFQSATVGDVHVMTEQVLRALDLCRPFRTIAEHVQVIMTAIPALKDRDQAVAMVLKNLADRGLLVRASEYLGKLSATGELADASDQPCVFVRGTPIGANALEAESGFQIHQLHNQPIASRVLDAACEQIPESQDVIRWLLPDPASAEQGGEGGEQRFAAGRQRNLAVLLGAGNRIAILDNDLELTARRMGVRDPGLTLAAASRPKIDFQSTYELAAEAGQTTGQSVLSSLFEHCGRQVGDLLAQPMAAGIGPQSLAGQDLQTLGQFTGDARVMTVTCGLYGADRRQHPLWPWLLPAGAREQFAGDQEDYLHNRDAGYVWRTLSDQRLGALQDQSPWCVDGREMLPPVLPHGRWEAGMFNALMRYLYPQDTCLELAFAIGHRAAPRPLFEGGEFTAMMPEMARFLADFADSRDNLSHAESASDRMDFLGSRMLDLAAADDRTLSFKLREYVAWFRSTLIRSLQEVMLGWPEAPEAWRDDIRTLIEANGRALAAAETPALDNGFGVTDEAQQVSVLRDTLSRFGEALVIWPQLWELASSEAKQWTDPSSH